MVNLESRDLEELLADFAGVLPEQLKTLNLIYTLWYKPADWNNMVNKPAFIAAGATAQEAREAVGAASIDGLLAVATALAERLPAYTGAGKIKVSDGVSPFTPIEIDLMAAAVADSIVQRTAGGQVKVADAANNDEAISLSQFNTRIPAYTAANRIKVSNGSSPFTPIERVVDTNATANSIPLRGTGGVQNTGDATADSHAVNRGQLSQRILDPATTIAGVQGIHVPINYYNGTTYAPGYQRVMDLLNGLTVSGGNNMLAKHFADGRLYAGKVTTDRDSVATIDQVQTQKLFKQAAHIAKSATANLTAAELLNGMIVCDTTSAAFFLNLPLATDLETALQTAYGVLAVDDAFRFKVMAINGASNGVTVSTNTGWTIIGSTSVGAWFYGEFIARRTGANAYTLYRV